MNDAFIGGMHSHLKVDQATESKRKVEQRLQELSEEFGQQDAELNAAASYRRLCDERQQQINEMQLESAKLRDEIAGLLASEQAAKAVVAERNRLRTTVDSQKQQLLDQLEKQRSVEASHSSSVRDFELIQEERDSLLQEFHCVLEQVKVKKRFYRSLTFSLSLSQIHTTTDEKKKKRKLLIGWPPACPSI